MEDHFDRLLTPEKALAFEFHERMSKGGRKKIARNLSIHGERLCLKLFLYSLSHRVFSADRELSNSSSSLSED